MATKRDYYEVLSVSRTATQAEIKKAFRRKAREYHPDVNNEAGAEEMFKQINEAHDVLSDEQKRAAYDRFGHAAFENAGGGGGAGGFQDIDLSDIFEGIFNNFGGGRGRSRRGPRKGQDLRYDLTLEFEEAVFGVEKSIDVNRPEICSDCSGSGAKAGTSASQCKHCNGAGEVRRVQQSILGSFVNVSPCPVCEGQGQIIETPCNTCHGRKIVQRSRNMNVKIPAGVDTDNQIRLTGEGGPGLHGGPAGNLYVVLNVKEHEFFKRQGDNVIVDLKINLAQATLGDEITIPTVDGDQTFTIPSGTQPGEMFTLRGKGIPRLRRGGRGDQINVVQVEIPKKLTEVQRNLFQQLSPTLGDNSIVPQAEKGGFWSNLKDAFLGD